MASLLGAIDCPDTYGEAPQELIPALVGAEGVVLAYRNQHPKVQRHPPRLLAGPGDQTEVGHLTNGVIAFGVTYDADESGRRQHFDDQVARTHAALRFCRTMHKDRSRISRRPQVGSLAACQVSREMIKPDNTQEPYQVWKIMFQTMDPTTKPWYWMEDIQNVTDIGNSIGTQEKCSHNINGTQVPPDLID
ncbi:hypothetical protein FJTKL_15328 [Diaporthe vaccinii]|uniref:Uncharacterized protein n=1 Tax=Diaporthe vaccinii TaxID=105482 RepID=A0ABR4E591_9PEZI